MKNVLYVIAMVLILTGCTYEPDNRTGPDQCLRAKIFKECMAIIPQSPLIVGKDSQWADVVNSCEKSSYYQSLRNMSYVKQECKTS